MSTISKHNPHYKLISVTIQNKEFVYGETNEGDIAGLEIYYYRPGELGHHYSRLHRADNIPPVYRMLFTKLKSMVSTVKPGHKLTLSLSDYQDIK